MLLPRMNQTMGLQNLGLASVWIFGLQLAFALCNPQMALGATEQRRCVPILDWSLSQQARTTSRTKLATLADGHEKVTNAQESNKRARDLEQVGAAGLGTSSDDSYSFVINDIEMPLSQTGSSVHTAMRLLATFDSQLYGGSEDYAGDSDEPARDNSIRFVQNKLHISGLNLTMLNVHLFETSEPRFALGLNIANTTLSGQFYYDGLTPALMGAELYSRLAGHYRMSIDNVLLTASSNLTKQRLARPVTAQQQLAPANSLPGEPVAGSQFEYSLRTNEFKMNISNLGYISIDILDAHDSTRPTSSYMLKMLQRVLQKTIKRTYAKFESYIRETLESEGRRFLDCELTRFTPLLVENAPPVEIVSGEAVKESLSAAASGEGPTRLRHTSLDDLARIISSEIARSRLAQVALPDFEHKRTVLGTSALIEFTNGSLTGLANVRLNGETRIKLQDEHLIVNASVGWFNLRPHYNWTLYLGSSAVAAHRREGSSPISPILASHLNSTHNQTLDTVALARNLQQLNNVTSNRSSSEQKPMARGFVAFHISAVDFDALIGRSLSPSTPLRLRVEELTIRRLDGPKMELGGLPGVNRLARGVVNFFMGRLKQRLVGFIQPALKTELERALNRLSA